MYLHENDIREIFSIIEKAFNKSTVMIETMSPFFVKHMKEKSIEAVMPSLAGVLKMEKIYSRLCQHLTGSCDVSLVEGMKVIMACL